jgi:TatD DNase family protein
VRALAEVRGEEPEALARASTVTAERVYGLRPVSG